MKFVEHEAKSRNPSTTATAPYQPAQLCLVQQAENLRLGERLPQLPYRNEGRKIQQGALDARAWNAVDHGHVRGLQRTVSVRGYASWASTSATGGGDVYGVASLRAKAPEFGGGTVGENRIWTTCENSRHELTIPREGRKTHREDAVMHGVESTDLHASMSRPSIDPQPAKLFE